MSGADGDAFPPTRPTAPDLASRPETKADTGFLSALFTAVNAPALAATGLPVGTVARLAAMQFRAQADSYKARFPQARRLILEHGGRAIGRLIVEREERDLYVVDRAILPEAQNRGLGGAAIAGLQREAAVAGLGVRALVMSHNGPSLALFQRRGFVDTGPIAGPSTELHWAAGREPASRPPAGAPPATCRRAEPAPGRLSRRCRPALRTRR